MVITPRITVFVIAALCFIAALLVALGVFHSNEAAWQDGGFLMVVAGFLIP